MQVQGLLVLNKPLGLRSTRSVDMVRKALSASGHNVKVGHGGTLDSSASGVLILLTGRATRLSSIVMQMPKSYDVTVRLGVETSTCDYTGEVTAEGDWGDIDGNAIEGMLPFFLGWRMQVPPEISAVHVGGERAHKIKRGGGTPDIEARPVFIRSISMTSPLSPDGEFRLEISCGKGTYVRSIVRDLGRKLGCGAHVAALARTAIGPFGLENAFELDDRPIDADRLIPHIRPLEELAGFLPFYTLYTLEENMSDRLLNGISVPLAAARRRTFGHFCDEGTVCVDSPRALTLAHIDSRDGPPMLVPSVNIVKEGAAV